MEYLGLIIFFSVVAIIGAVGVWFFHFGRSAIRKRKILPFYAIAAAVVFGTSAEYWTPTKMVLMIAWPVISVITLLYIRNSRFCDNCGRGMMSLSFTPPRYCPACGSQLQHIRAGNH
jgi:hypothetical protein